MRDQKSEQLTPRPRLDWKLCSKPLVDVVMEMASKAQWKEVVRFRVSIQRSRLVSRHCWRQPVSSVQETQTIMMIMMNSLYKKYAYRVALYTVCTYFVYSMQKSIYRHRTSNLKIPSSLINTEYKQIQLSVVIICQLVMYVLLENFLEVNFYAILSTVFSGLSLESL